jgi:hypothetical protein
VDLLSSMCHTSVLPLLLSKLYTETSSESREPLGKVKLAGLADFKNYQTR